jgi:hypothetical protein
MRSSTNKKILLLLTMTEADPAPEQPPPHGGKSRTALAHVLPAISQIFSSFSPAINRLLVGRNARPGLLRRRLLQHLINNRSWFIAIPSQNRQNNRCGKKANRQKSCCPRHQIRGAARCHETTATAAAATNTKAAAFTALQQNDRNKRDGNQNMDGQNKRFHADCSHKIYQKRTLYGDIAAFSTRMVMLDAESNENLLRG